MSSQLSSQNFGGKFKKKICDKHIDQLKPKINHVYIGKEFAGTSRFYCQYCVEDEDTLWENVEKKHKIKVAINNITDYNQVNVSEQEPPLETKLPLNKEIKEKCRVEIKQYMQKEKDQIELINSFIDRLEEEVSSHIEVVRDKALIYYNKLKSLGQKLEDRYKVIVDCSKIKEIIEETQDQNELNQKMSEFIIERLKTDNLNRELSQLYQEFTNTHNLYIVNSFDTLETVITQVAQKINFDISIEPSLQQYNNSINQAISMLGVQKAQQRNQFGNVDNFQNYKIEVQPDKSESLTPNQTELMCAAKFVQPLRPDTYYQFIFELSCSNPQSQLKKGDLTISLGQDDQLNSVPHCKKFWNSTQKGCCFVQCGEDLSTLNYEKIIVVANININKNQFYFTDKNRNSKNTMAKRESFKSDAPYYLYVSSIGQVGISLLHVEQITQS